MTGAGSPRQGEAPLVFLIAGEESGDALGAALMRALKQRLPGVNFAGVGGQRMQGLGLRSIFPIETIQLHGLAEVLTRLPELVRRIRSTADEVVGANPDVLVLVDAPAFNLRVARRVRARAPAIPIIDYVSPAVWAWAPWRAGRMRPHVDHLMAILPFEPEVHRRLGGPPTTFVGHPVSERLPVLRGERRDGRAASGRPVLLVLPGSRASEIRRLMDRFGQAVGLVASARPGIEIILPAVPALADEIRARAAEWPVAPHIVVGEEEKLAAFRRADAALAASGTVTLELALAGVPMVVAYRVDPFLRILKPLLMARSVVLANLISGENAIPEFLDSRATPPNLAAALLPLLSDTPERQRQLASFAELERRMDLGGAVPSDRAAAIVVDAMRR